METNMQKLLAMKSERLEKRNQLITMLAKDGKTPEYDEAYSKYEAYCKSVDEMERLVDEEKAAGQIDNPVNPVTKAVAAPSTTDQTAHSEAVKAFANAARQGFKASSGTPMSEGVDTDGGYTVPNDMVTRIITLRDSKQSLLDEVTVVPTHTDSGSRTKKKRSQVKGFTTVAEKQAIGAVATPEFETVKYSIEKRSGILPVTKELVADSDANIAQQAEEWLADEGRVSANNEIVAEIKRAWSPKAVTSVDEIKDIWLKLGPAFRAVSKIVTNTNGLSWLGLQVDGKGNPILNEIPSQPGVMQLCVGPYKIPIKEYDNDTVPNATTKIPFFIGCLKDAIWYWDRQQLTVERSTTAVVGDLNAFEDDLVLWKGTIRDDCTAFDTAALVFAEVDTAHLAAAVEAAV